MKKLHLFSVLAISAALVGCGESFQGRFSGDAISIFQASSSCFSGAQTNQKYYMEVIGQVSGDDVEITIAKLVKKEDQSSDVLSIKMTGISAGAPLVSDSRFANDAQSFSNTDKIYATAEGTITTGRDEINSLVVTYNGQKADGSPCQNALKADSLKLMP